ncbi:MAG TPA: S8 family serine peptidase [Gaiellaceae bacterium]|jgi:hypothetical protein|nr:S8 family serine peptidase [Gaiellaceae bacterium]
MRLLRRPEFRIVLVAAIGVGAWLTVRSSHGPATTPLPPAAAASWNGLVGPSRPAVTLTGLEIVVLRTPSVAQRLARAKQATEEAERRWTAGVYAAQQQVLTQLARHGFTVRPDYSFARVLDGFSATLDPSAVALLEHNPEVAGVYPVRVAYPAALSTAAPVAGGISAGTAVRLPGFDGTGETIALLDTGVDLSHPYIEGRVEAGIDIVGGTGSAAAQTNPQNRRQVERHGTELAGVLVGAGGPNGIHGVAKGASVLPIRVAGWQPAASGRNAVYARSDQLIAGLDRAVDPNADGDTHDAVRIALLGVAEPFASFPDSPESQAVDGALALDTLVVAPAGNDGLAGPLFGSIAGPSGAEAALTVGATDSRSATASVRIVFRQGLAVLADGSLPLIGTVSPNRSTELELARPGAPGSLQGKAALVAAGVNPAATVSAAVGDGAAAVLVYGRRLPSGALAGSPVPVIGVPESYARPALASLRQGFSVVVAIGHTNVASNPDQGRVAPFSSRGLTFGGLLDPQLAAPGVAIETSDPGSAGDGEPAFVSVTGTSVAAAEAAGSAALLSEARPGLSAEDIASLLTGSARSFGAGGTAAGAGLVDPGASAVGEVAASATTLAFGPWNGPKWHEKRLVTVRNVSTRPLILALSSSSRLIDVEPASLQLAPGATATVQVTAAASSRPALSVVSGGLTVKPAGSQALRIPWAIVFRPFTGSLIGQTRISPVTFSPSDSHPAVLTVVAGRIGGGKIVEIEPVARLDLLLYTAGGAYLGVLARVPDLLPGAYNFGLTGRGPNGAVLPPGSYEIRIVARPTLAGAASRSKIGFRIE